MDQNEFSKRKLLKKRGGTVPPTTVKPRLVRSLVSKFSLALGLVAVGVVVAYYIGIAQATNEDNQKTNKEAAWIEDTTILKKENNISNTSPSANQRAIQSDTKEKDDTKAKKKQTETKSEQIPKKKPPTEPQPTTQKPATKKPITTPIKYPYSKPIQSKYFVYIQNHEKTTTSIYSAPNTSNPIGTIRHQAPILILCQIRGTTVNSQEGGPSNLWNKIGDNQFIPDIHTYTGHDSFVESKCN